MNIDIISVLNLRTDKTLGTPTFNNSRHLFLKITGSLIMCTLLSLAPQETYATPRGPLIERDAQATRCEYPSDELSGEVRLDHRCYYEQAFEITEPDTTVDCNGAELRGDGAYLINIKRSADRAQVRNCYLRGGKGIAVRTRKARGEERPEDVRALSPADVVLSNLHISESEGVGVHIHVYTTGVTIKDSIIRDNSSAGFYLSPYGKHHRIENNLIANNGHFKPDGTPRLAWYRREGIAIDGSSEHQIIDNDIVDNAFGGVLLYKNCWEHAEDEPDSRPRTEHARANLIQGNRFADQPFGVWVAARQSRDLEQMGCGDPTPYLNPINVTEVLPAIYQEHPSSYVQSYLFSFNSVSIWPDFAEENIIKDNRFDTHSLGGIRVEDDDTEITGNLFVGDYDYIFLGAPFRARLDDHPVMNTLIRDNAYLTAQPSAFIDNLALMPEEHINTTLEENDPACLNEDGQVMWPNEIIELTGEAPCGDEIWSCVEGTLVRRASDSDCHDLAPPSELDFGPDQSVSQDALLDSTQRGADVTEDRRSVSSATSQDQGCSSSHRRGSGLWGVSLVTSLLIGLSIRVRRRSNL